MTKLFTFLFLLFLLQPVSGQELEEQYHAGVQTFIDCVKKKDADALSSLISFPLRRAYPIPAVKDTADFRARFSEIFDDSLIALISSSNVKTDWSQVGWRGIMLHQGLVWLDDDGMLIGINYQSKIEAATKQQLIEEDRNSIHESLKVFANPEVILETKKFRVRIDEMDDGTYRYASWAINSEMSAKPDLILTGGTIEFMGSGGNHFYEFKSGPYKYICYINILGTNESSPADLVVLKGKKEILNQEAIIWKP